MENLNKIYFRSGMLGIVLSLISIANASADSLPLKQNTPIEITADKLSVMQQDQQAIFEGNVTAVQGDMTLNAEEMQVFYKNKNPKETTPSLSNTEETAITHLKVKGKVKMKTPKESALGDKGEYDVVKGILRLQGNVTLIRDQNMIKGEHLTYNINTGKSQITGQAASKQKGGRVKSIFVPQAPKP